jgi:hypothetical protein
VSAWSGGGESRSNTRSSPGSSASTGETSVASAVVAVRVDAGISLVGDVRAVRTSSGAVGSASSRAQGRAVSACSSGGVSRSNTSTGSSSSKTLVASTVVAVRVDAGIGLVGDVRAVRTSSGAASGAMGSAIARACSSGRVSRSKTGTSSSASDTCFMASTVVTVRVDTGVELVGDVGAVGPRSGAASGAVGRSVTSAGVSST